MMQTQQILKIQEEDDRNVGPFVCVDNDEDGKLNTPL